MKTIHIVIGLIVMVLLLFTLPFLGDIMNAITLNDCLKETAEDYCEDNGMYFGGTTFPRGFLCSEDERSIDFKPYKFLDDEIEDCKK